MHSIYITGTDTGIGKTFVTAGLLTALNRQGFRAIGMKPVATGSVCTPNGLKNNDALQLIAHSHYQLDYSLINPYVFEEAVAPHIAAAQAGITIELNPIKNAFEILHADADAIVVEGVGGWAVPFSSTLMQADLVNSLGLPVILVVGLRLGCINHALLTAQGIAADKCRLLGWIGNAIDPDFDRSEENLATLKTRLGVPCLGVVPLIPNGLPAHADSFLEQAVSMLNW